MTIKTKAINKGAIPIFTAVINLFPRLEAKDEDISFTTNSAINTRMPTRANEAASAGIIRDNSIGEVMIEDMMALFQIRQNSRYSSYQIQPREAINNSELCNNCVLKLIFASHY
jgi:hypothetical protein